MSRARPERRVRWIARRDPLSILKPGLRLVEAALLGQDLGQLRQAAYQLGGVPASLECKSPLEDQLYARYTFGHRFDQNLPCPQLA